ncbi:histamine N-methyltransferase-like [Ptychodera flava]|uniref:histamine N-methyltransferase-like n=1 Tax=Ptychodera flava TaxID=63121 RepID=UPI00396A794B
MESDKSNAELLDSWPSYEESLEEWHKRSDERRWFSAWIENDFTTDVLKKITLPVNEDGLRHLDVGSGEGKACCELLEVTLKQHPKVVCRSVEPMAGEQQKFKDLVKERDLGGVTFEFVEQTTEEYEKRPNVAADKKFHLITLLQMIIVVDDIEKTIMHYHDNEMEKGSVMVITLAADETPTRLCEPIVAELQKVQLKFSADVRQVLERNHLNYTQKLIPYRIDVTNCFDDSSRQGELLLEMVTIVPEFGKRAGSDVKKKVLDVLESCSKTENDKIYATFGFDIPLPKDIALADDRMKKKYYGNNVKVFLHQWREGNDHNRSKVKTLEVSYPERRKQRERNRFSASSF